jgi:hypothetical protein
VLDVELQVLGLGRVVHSCLQNSTSQYLSIEAKVVVSIVVQVSVVVQGQAAEEASPRLVGRIAVSEVVGEDIAEVWLT